MVFVYNSRNVVKACYVHDTCMHCYVCDTCMHCYVCDTCTHCYVHDTCMHCYVRDTCMHYELRSLLVYSLSINKFNNFVDFKIYICLKFLIYLEKFKLLFIHFLLFYRNICNVHAYCKHSIYPLTYDQLLNGTQIFTNLARSCRV